MRRRTFGQGRGIILKPNEIFINQKEDTEVLYHDVQDVINSVKQGVHRYHAKQEGDVLYATQLDDTNSARYVDGQTAEVSNVNMGDTFSYIPGFYATLMLQKKDIWVYRFSKEPVNEDSFFFGDVFIGSYGGDFTNGNINSLSHPDTSTGTNKTRDQLEQMASSKGKGYLLTDLSMHNLVGLLYVAIHHNTDCKGTLGSGAATADRPCGSSTPYGITESKPGDIFTNFLGIENWWGGRYEVVGRLNANVGKIDGIYYVVEEDGSTRKIQSLAPLSQWLYPRKMILGKRFDIVADPSCYQEEITAGHGWNSEQYMRNEADRIVIRGGYQADISSGFAFLAARFTNTESGSFSTITGRLAYKGKYKFVDTDEYRQMFDPNWINQYQGGVLKARLKRTQQNNVALFSKDYVVIGDIDVSVDGRWTKCLKDKTLLLEDDQEHNIIIGFHQKQKNGERMFADLDHYTYFNSYRFYMNDFTSLKEMFCNCVNLSESWMSGNTMQSTCPNVTTIQGMYKNCTNLGGYSRPLPNDGSMASLMYADEAFMNCTSIPIGTYIDSNGVISMRYAYYNCINTKSGGIGILDIKLEDASHAYDGCTNMTRFGYLQATFSHLKDASYMFNKCSKLHKVALGIPCSGETIDVNTEGMFNGVSENGELITQSRNCFNEHIVNTIPETWESYRKYEDNNWD